MIFPQGSARARPMHDKESRFPIGDPWFWALAALSVLLGCAPVWTGGWLAAHEGPSYLFRSGEFSALLSQGELYPRWCPDFYWGYGYPFFVFYSPALFYLTSILIALGARADVALHIVTILGTAGIFLGGYRFCRLFAGDGAARVGAALTTLATYRFVQYFIRGDLAEAFATSLVPLALAEGVILCRRGGRAASARLAVLLALVFYGHTLTAVATAAALAVMGLSMLVRRNGRAFLRVAGASALGVLLAAAHWVPAFIERRFVSTERMLRSESLGAEWGEHFVSWWQRLSPHYGFGLSVPGPADKISFASSYVVWALIIGAAVLAFRRAAFRKRAMPLILGWAAVNIIQLSISTPVWAAIPYIEYFQFPWRFLLLELVIAGALASVALDELVAIGALARAVPSGIAGLLLLAGLGSLAIFEYAVVLSDFWGVLGGSEPDEARIAWWWPHVFIVGLAVGLGIFFLRALSHSSLERLVIVAAFVFALPPALVSMLWAIYKPMPLDAKLLDAVKHPIRIQQFGTREKHSPDPVPVTTAAQDEYRPRTARIDASRPPAAPGRTSDGSGTVRVLGQRGDRRRYEVEAEGNGSFEAAYLFYPGVRASVDGRPAKVRPDDLGLVSVDLPAGRHVVEVWYGASGSQRAGYWITLLGAALVAGVVLWPRDRKTRAPTVGPGAVVGERVRSLGKKQP